MQQITNQWIVDESYGAGIALGFQGDEEFREESANFCYNHGVISPVAKVHGDTNSNFQYVITTVEKLVNALKAEGRILKMQEILHLSLDEETYEKTLEKAALDHCVKHLKDIKKEDFLKYVKTKENDV